MAYNKAIIWKDGDELKIKITFADKSQKPIEGTLPSDIKTKEIYELCKGKGVEPQHCEFVQ